MKSIHFLSFIIISAFLVLCLIFITIPSSSSVVDAFIPPAEEGEDQEEKYRPMIRCLVCENMIKRLIHKMNTTHKNLGTTVRGGSMPSYGEEGDKKKEESPQERKRRRATVSAWAHEIVTTKNLCRFNPKTDGKDEYLKKMNEEEAIKGPKASIYCEQALEATEDKLIKFATIRKMNESVASIDINETSQRICTQAKYCKFRSEIKKQMEDAQENARQQFMANYPMWKLVLAELQKNMLLYIGVFFGTLIIVGGGMIFYKYNQIKNKIKQKRYEEALARLKKEQMRAVVGDNVTSSSSDDDEDENDKKLKKA